MFKLIFCLLFLAQNIANADPDIPEQLKAPGNNKAILTLHAKGDQIYQCTSNNDKHVWQLLAPDTELFDTQGQLAGRHSAGPAWQFKDGSRIVGKTIAQVKRAPLASIPWLLIEVVEHEGQGLLSRVNFIQRINTEGGLPPLSPCNTNHLGSEKRIAYTADYVFYALQG